MTSAAGGEVRVRAPTHTVQEIEGLRALAVLAVLVNHAFPALLPGGFCGVDIFFVISGYVVGGRLLAEAGDAGSLRLGAFYAARARRLLPALVATLAVTCMLGWVFLTGPELSALGKHVVATGALSNNFLLASEAGYFDAPSATKPLLHLWSLAIEEQFYLLAPLLIWAACATRRPPARWVLRLGALSLAWMVWREDAEPASLFYHPAFRFWEIAVGVAVAHWKTNQARGVAVSREPRVWAAVLLLLLLLRLMADTGSPVAHTQLAGLLLLATCSVGVLGLRTLPDRALVRSNRLVAAAGAVLVLASLLASSPIGWPGAQAALPVLGTALLLASTGASGTLFTALRSKPAVFVGSISYPLYLWHWPALVFSRLLFPELGAVSLAGVLVLATVLAWATARFIENPIRFGRAGGSRPGPFVPLPLLLCVAAVPVCVGLGAALTDGFPSRFGQNTGAVARWNYPRAYDEWRVGSCYYYLNDQKDFAPHCSPKPDATRKTVLLWGDSHAAHLYPGLLAASRQEQAFQIAQWTMGSCPPTLVFPQASPDCERRRQMWRRQLHTYRADVVVLGGAWGLYVRAGRTPASLAEDIRKTILEVRGAGHGQVLLVGPGPLWEVPVASALFRSMVLAGIDRIPQRFEGRRADLVALDRLLRDTAATAGAAYFSPLEAMCNGEGCQVLGSTAAQAPDLLFFDKDHLSHSGSLLVAGLAMPTLQSLLEAGPAP